MVLLGLTLGELIALAAVLGGFVSVLYFADRKRRRKVVSTLQFWAAAPANPAWRKFVRLREPWSLALQLVSLALLLLAIAHPRLGPRNEGRDYVLILDTSAWTAEATGGETVLEREKRAANEFLQRLSSADRVLVLRADSRIAPATLFTTNRKEIAAAIETSATTPGALDLERALSFAETAERTQGNPGGTIYIGPGMVFRAPANAAALKNLRVIEIGGSHDNCGIRRIAAERRRTDARAWNISVSVKNYGTEARVVPVSAAFAGHELALQSLALAPGEESQAEFVLQTNSAGQFTAEIRPRDALTMDDRAQLDLPASSPVRVAVITDRPQLLRPLFDSDEWLAPVFYAPSAYRAGEATDIVVFDRFAPARQPQVPALWIDPPASESPLPVTTVERPGETVRWNSSPDLITGLNETPALPSAEVFQLFEGDIAVASVRQGPVIVARPGRPQYAVIGFDPFDKTLRSRIATPLLVANLLHWLAPEAFGVEETQAVPAGFAPPSAGEAIFSNLPGVAAIHWTPPPGVATGLPPRSAFVRKPDTFWKWCAVLAAILLVMEWFLFGRRKRAYGRLAIKAASVAAIAWALAMPAVEARSSRVAAAILVDQSASIPPAEQARASSIAEAIESARGDNWARVIPFASGEASNTTDLEMALLEGAASLPEGYVPRLVLLSDGYENEGSATRAVSEISALHARVDTIPLNARSGAALRVVSAGMEGEGYAGERVPIELSVYAQAGGHGSVELSADGKPLGMQAIELTPGVNHIRVRARVNSTGVVQISGIVREGANEASFARALSLRRGCVLYISGDLPDSDGNLLAALRAAGLDVVQDAPIETALGGVQLVVLNDVDLASLTPDEKAQLETFVEGGGGLLLIGGGREVFRRHEPMDALDRVLPAEVAPPEGTGGTAVALIIDKSSSMEGRKIQLARLSAIGVVDHLRPTDTIGVLMFDNSYRWAVPMRKASDKARINRSIAGITPNGGTQIAPALGEAYRKVLASKAVYKHIVLLTDGISEAGDSFDLARDALAHQVTISTVGLGLDVNRPYLEKVAAISGGHSYFLSQPQGLQQIVLKDVKNFTGTSAVEKPLKPIVDRAAQILDGVGMNSAPALKGYTRFTAKPDAETILSINPERKDPLYVEWQYGLGRTAVFASDAKSRWADSWISWPGFDKFWINVSRELLKQPENRARAVYDSADGDIVVRYRMPPDANAPLAPPEIFAIGPGGFEKRVEIEKAAPDLYYGRVYIGNTRGLIRIRPVVDSDAFPETGIYRGDAESTVYGTNETLLRRIAAGTGGRYDPPPSSVFDAQGGFVYRRLELWPGLLGLAIALGIVELVARKWGGLAGIKWFALNVRRLRNGTFAETSR